MNQAKILIWDCETSPLLVWTWGAYQANAVDVIEQSQLLCYAYKWAHEKTIHVIGQDDDPNYIPGKNNDEWLTKELHKLFDEADIIIAHNGDSFDQKVAQGRMMVHNLLPPSPYKQIDTKKVAKKYGRFATNKLDDLGEVFNLGRKTKHEGFDMWLKVMDGDASAWNKMKKYCKQDVNLENKLYLKLRPWIQSHPSVSVINDMPDTCPACASTQLRQGGFFTTKTGKYKRYQCLGCGKWCHGRLRVNNDNPPVYVS